jgi:hypothetical protein
VPLSPESMVAIAKALPNASSIQLYELRGKISALLQLQESKQVLAHVRANATTIFTEPEDDWLFDGICHELSRCGMITKEAMPSIRRSPAFKAYQPKAVGIRRMLLKRAIGLPNSPLARGVLGRQVAWCLAVSIERWGTVSTTFMLNNVEKVPEAVEEQFPGYLASGFLAKLVQIKRHGT